MLIKITKSVLHLGYGYRPGFTGDVPDEIAQRLVGMGRAVVLPAATKPKEVEPEVKKTVIKQSRKR